MLTSAKVQSLVIAACPGTNPTSIIASDHAGPNPRSGRSYCKCSGTDRQIFTRKDGLYLVRETGECDESAESAPKIAHSRLEYSISVDRELSGDFRSVVEALTRIRSIIRPSLDRAWARSAAVRVIDCVLSLNRRYDSFVVPRLDEFESSHPEVRTVGDLKDLIARHRSPSLFVMECLQYHDVSRSETLVNVVDWLLTVAGSGDHNAQLSKLQSWAENSKPDEYTRLGISGFGLGGFQYLRMLFGANTTKPDIHIRRYVATCVGHPVSDIQALRLLELGAREVGVSLRDVDTTLWERSARPKD